MKPLFQSFTAASLLAVAAHAQTSMTVLKPAQFQHYVELFTAQEREATGAVYPGESNEDEWTWMQREIPFFESSDKSFEEMY